MNFKDCVCAWSFFYCTKNRFLKNSLNYSVSIVFINIFARQNNTNKTKLDKNLKDLIGEDGKKLSPILPDNVKNYLIDIDGTITDDVPNEEPERMPLCVPYPDALEILNKWYEQGHIITFFTSRTEEEHRKVTKTWLDKHGFKYQGLLMGKPRGGNYHWIDNHIVKATKFNGKFTDLVNEKKTIEVFKK